MRIRVRAYGVALLACLVLAGWALWSGGLFDGPAARAVRTGSVYAAPGVPLDTAAAERVIGNRRLVVIFLDRGADLRKGCESVRHAAAGTVVILLSPEDDEWDTYGCAQLPGADDETFGKAFVAESVLPRGVDQFGDRPLEAVKVIAVNYDMLVRSGTVPDGARTVSPSLPRYLVAAGALLGVVVGAGALHLAARRIGRAAAARQETRLAAADARSRLRAAAADLAQRIIDLDGRGPEAKALAVAYTDLLADIADAEGRDDAALTARVEALNERARRVGPRPPRRTDGPPGPAESPRERTVTTRVRSRADRSRRRRRKRR